jgi:hypothetical protein
VSFAAYLGTGHFGEAVFEIWESEFLQRLAIVLFGLFLISFVSHLLTGTAEYNTEQELAGRSGVSVGQFLLSSDFWFQSMQNWQSEFLAVGSLVVLTIFLRQKGSPQSKPMSAPNSQTGT